MHKILGDCVKKRIFCMLQNVPIISAREINHNSANRRCPLQAETPFLDFSEDVTSLKDIRKEYCIRKPK
jgi:hypothetical protein